MKLHLIKPRKYSIRLMICAYGWDKQKGTFVYQKFLFCCERAIKNSIKWGKEDQK